MTDPQTTTIRVERLVFAAEKITNLEAEVTRLTQERDAALALLFGANDERPASLAEGIRLLELTLNAEHERAEQAEADLLLCQQALADIATASDMTLRMARKKARRVYDAIPRNLAPKEEKGA